MPMNRFLPLPSRESGSGETLVLVHGWGMSSGVWDDMARSLARDHRVICVDLPGHGAAAAEAALGKLDVIADRLAASLPGSGGHLIAWSLGALPAIRCASRHPRRLRSLIMVAGTPRFVTGPDWDCAMQPAVLEAFAADLRDDHRGTLNRFLALQFRGLPEAQGLLRSLRARLLAESPASQALQEGLEMLRQTDLRPELSALSCPVGVILGARDNLVPAELAAALGALRPDLRVGLLEQAGHAPFLSRPTQFETMLRGFLQDMRHE